MITRRKFFSVIAVWAASYGRSHANDSVTVLAPEPRADSRVADLARNLSTANLSVTAAPGYGPAQNVARLLSQRGVEVAVLPADVLDYLRRRRAQPEAAGSLRYIGQLYSAPVQVLAQQRIASMAQLAGQRVSFGPQDSVSYVTGSQLFSLLGLPVEPLLMGHSEALRRLLRRELAAIVYAGTVPERMFSDLNRQQDGVQFLPLRLTPGLSRTYLPAQLSIQDYPLLIGEGEAGIGSPVPTIAVPMLLAVYNWPLGSPAHRALSLFAAQFVRISPTALEPPGWTRFVPETASQAIAQNPVSPPGNLASEQREKLFREYENWRREQRREALFEDYLRWLQNHRP
ncbi:MAG: hypothetical protein JOY71_09690 [Acetobacteraceae bacterium]|nr:hypothetical protein [Acetobacteraceae bacterium]